MAIPLIRSTSFTALRHDPVEYLDPLRCGIPGKDRVVGVLRGDQIPNGAQTFRRELACPETQRAGRGLPSLLLEKGQTPKDHP
jgi:hypothetical protein